MDASCGKRCLGLGEREMKTWEYLTRHGWSSLATKENQETSSGMAAFDVQSMLRGWQAQACEWTQKAISNVDSTSSEKRGILWVLRCVAVVFLCFPVATSFITHESWRRSQLIISCLCCVEIARWTNGKLQKAGSRKLKRRRQIHQRWRSSITAACAWPWTSPRIHEQSQTKCPLRSRATHNIRSLMFAFRFACCLFVFLPFLTLSPLPRTFPIAFSSKELITRHFWFRF